MSTAHAAARMTTPAAPRAGREHRIIRAATGAAAGGCAARSTVPGTAAVAGRILRACAWPGPRSVTPSAHVNPAASLDDASAKQREGETIVGLSVGRCRVREQGIVLQTEVVKCVRPVDRERAVAHDDVLAFVSQVTDADGGVAGEGETESSGSGEA